MAEVLNQPINTKEELQNIIVLGLSVYLCSVTESIVAIKTPIRIVKMPGGQYIHFDISARYLRDVNIPDEDHYALKRMPWKYEEYLFNTEEDALAWL